MRRFIGLFLGVCTTGALKLSMSDGRTTSSDSSDGGSFQASSGRVHAGGNDFSYGSLGQSEDGKGFEMTKPPSTPQPRPRLVPPPSPPAAISRRHSAKYVKEGANSIEGARLFNRNIINAIRNSDLNSLNVLTEVPSLKMPIENRSASGSEAELIWPINVPQEDGVVPLIAAASHSDKAFVRAILKVRGVDVNFKWMTSQSDFLGMTALLVACDKSYEHVVREILFRDYLTYELRDEVDIDSKVFVLNRVIDVYDGRGPAIQYKRQWTAAFFARYHNHDGIHKLLSIFKKKKHVQLRQRQREELVNTRRQLARDVARTRWSAENVIFVALMAVVLLVMMSLGSLFDYSFIHGYTFPNPDVHRSYFRGSTEMTDVSPDPSHVLEPPPGQN